MTQFFFLFVYIGADLFVLFFHLKEENNGYTNFYCINGT